MLEGQKTAGRLLRPLLVVAALLFAFGLVAEVAVEAEPRALDRALLLAFRHADNPSEPIGPPWLQEAARDITSLGSTAVLGFLLFTVAAFLFLDGKHGSAWLMLGAVLGGVTLNSLLKLTFGRPRPDLTPVVDVFTYSFPSGHAAMSAITFLTLGALLSRTHRSARMRGYFMAIGGTLTFLVGISRVYLGVHYPTDVLAGWCIGIAWATACWALMTELQRRRTVEQPDSP